MSDDRPDAATHVVLRSDDGVEWRVACFATDENAENKCFLERARNPYEHHAVRRLGGDGFELVLSPTT